MAEAAAKHVADGSWEIWSAGSHPSGRVHPVAVETMKELGMELSSHHSKGLADVPQQLWDYVVTMGCGDACPQLPAARRIDWQIPDPARQPIEAYRSIVDLIERQVHELLAELSSSRVKR